MLLLRRQYEFSFGINVVQFSLFFNVIIYFFQVTTIQSPQPIIQQLPPVINMDTGNPKDKMFNKAGK